MPSQVPPGIRRLCFVVDVESYSNRTHVEQIDVQHRVRTALGKTIDHTGVRPSHILRQDRGDGQLLIFPPGTDEARALPSLIGGLTDALARVNKGKTPRLRLRAAISQGIVHVASMGYVGRAVVDACRLLDSDQLKRSLKSAQKADLVVAVTDDLFTDIIAQRYPGLPDTVFRRTTFAIPEKKFSAVGWIHVAGDERIKPPPGPGPLAWAAALTGTAAAGVVAGGVAATVGAIAFEELVLDDDPFEVEDHHDTADDYLDEPHEDDHEDDYDDDPDDHH